MQRCFVKDLISGERLLLDTLNAYKIQAITESLMGCCAAWVKRYSPLYITGAGLCFNMRLRSEGLDIPRLECMIGPQTQIHVTDFQRLVRELHSGHISPFYIRANRIWLHKAFPPPRGECFTCRQTDVCILAGVYVCLWERVCVY